MKGKNFSSFRTVLVPIVHGCQSEAALQAARALDAQVILVGLVPVPAEASLSTGAAQARLMRQRLHGLAEVGHFSIRAKVLVSHTPWLDLMALVETDEPDLLLLQFETHFAALGVSPAEALMRPPCNVALVRGPFPAAPLRVLVPVRGGPHAELALRAGLSLKAEQLTTLHLAAADSHAAKADAPFRGLQRILSQMPEVQAHAMITADPAATIL
jgi:hypothetical protein